MFSALTQYPIICRSSEGEAVSLPPSPDQVIAPPLDFDEYYPPPPPRKYGPGVRARNMVLMTPNDFGDAAAASPSNSLAHTNGVPLNGVATKRGFGRGSHLHVNDDTVGHPKDMPHLELSPPRISAQTTEAVDHQFSNASHPTNTVTRKPPVAKDLNNNLEAAFVVPPAPSIDRLMRPSTPGRPENSLLLPKAMVGETAKELGKLRIVNEVTEPNRSFGEAATIPDEVKINGARISGPVSNGAAKTAGFTHQAAKAEKKNAQIHPTKDDTSTRLSSARPDFERKESRKNSHPSARESEGEKSSPAPVKEGNRRTKEEAKATTKMAKSSANSPRKLLNFAELFRGGKCEISATRDVIFAHSASLDYPQGVAVDDGPDGTGNVYVCAMPNHRVVVFNPEGKFLRAFGTTGDKQKSPAWQPGQLWRPSGVVCHGDGVFVKDMHRIQEFDREGAFRRSFGAEVLHEPYGLVVNRYGHMITIDVDRQRSPHLRIFDGSGDLMHQRPLKALSDPELIAQLRIDDRRSRCRFLGVFGEHVYAVDLGLNRVFVCDFDGNHVAQFGAKGRLVGQFEDAAGIAFDAFGNFVVADSKNSRLHVFDADRNLLGLIRAKDVPSRPSALFVSNDGALFVCSIWGKCVKKYVFDN